jgi:hypothetical protein
VSDPAVPSTSFQPALGFSFDQTVRRWREAGKRVLVVARGGEAPFPNEDIAPFDAAWIAPVTLENVDVSELGQWVASVLRPGAPVACSIPGCRPLRALLERALRGTGELPRPDRARFEGRRAPCISVSAWRKAFGPEFTWRRVRAVGALLPVRAARSRAEERALLMYGLGTMEHLLGSWPIVRGLGDRALLEGVRR